MNGPPGSPGHAAVGAPRAGVVAARGGAPGWARGAWLERPRVGTAVAALCYLTLSLAYFGRAVLAHPDRVLIGSGTDPQLFVWALAWWPHALGLGQNPVISHVLWAPAGSDLVWSTAIPGLALPLAPVTLLAGPITAYNVAALLLPAASALAAFALCRELTRRFWPSLLGGYLFGFSTYLLGHELGHLHLTAVFVVPLVALVVVRALEGAYSAYGLVGRLGLLLALQFALATEVFFTLSLALAAGLALAASAPARRGALRALVPRLAGGYALAFVLVSPLLYYALSDFDASAVTPTNGAGADLVSFAFPTGLTELGGGLAPHFDPSLPLVSSENGQYLGIPLLLICADYLWRRRRTATGRALAGGFALAFLFTLGNELRVRGVAIVPLPWRLLEHLPLFDDVIPGRLSLYLALLGALTAALWTASPVRGRGLRAGGGALALLALVPALGLSAWHQLPEQPRFFTGPAERRCLTAGENTLVLPPPFRNEALLWQAEDGFRFRIADGGLNYQLPASLPERALGLRLVANKIPAGGAAAVLSFARATGVGAILVDAAGGAQWRALLGPVLPGRQLGGVDVYSLGSAPPSCG